MTKLDAINMQECLWSYSMLLERMTTDDKFEEAMKNDRMKVVHYLIDKCEDVING